MKNNFLKFKNIFIEILQTTLPTSIPKISKVITGNLFFFKKNMKLFYKNK